jgi:hypothetical protein
MVEKVVKFNASRMTEVLSVLILLEFDVEEETKFGSTVFKIDTSVLRFETTVNGKSVKCNYQSLDEKC